MVWLKRLNVPKNWPIEKKTKKFVTVPRGPNKKFESLPLAVVLRDVLKLAENSSEARKIIKKREIFVDGRIVRDPKYGISLLDVIEIPKIGKAYRVISGFRFIEVDDAKLKLCKIIGKKILKKGRIQLNLSSGKNILVEKQYPTNDSLLIELPVQKIIEHLKFEKNSLIMITQGKNAGKISKIKNIDEKERRVILEDNSEVPIDYVIVIGKERLVIKLGE